MNNDAVSSLQSLGFSDYEARAYVALVEAGPLTGYQLAKRSGVPRPNIYAVLDKLQSRGVVTSVQAESGQLYASRPPAEVLASIRDRLESDVETAGGALEALSARKPVELAWNIQGRPEVIARARALIDGARETLLVGTWSEESRSLGEALDAADRRGVNIATLCIQGCAGECGACRGDIHRFALGEGAAARWLVVVADEAEVLTGQIWPDGRAEAAASRQESLVAMAAQYLRNTIAVTEIVRSLGVQLERVVDARALAALRSAGMAQGGRSWLERLRSVVQRGAG
jgi:predicted transcriptional regulator